MAEVDQEMEQAEVGQVTAGMARASVNDEHKHDAAQSRGALAPLRANKLDVRAIPGFAPITKQKQAPALASEHACKAQLEYIKFLYPSASFEEEDCKLREAARKTIDGRIKSEASKHLLESHALLTEKTNLDVLEDADNNAFALRAAMKLTQKIEAPRLLKEQTKLAKEQKKHKKNAAYAAAEAAWYADQQEATTWAYNEEKRKRARHNVEKPKVEEYEEDGPDYEE